jgi:ABC-type branched-subunit amino acid transport system permease subunit
MAATVSRHSTLKEPIVMIVFAVVGAVIFGFLAGLLAFRVKSRWCPACGTTTSALVDRHHQASHARR